MVAEVTFVLPAGKIAADGDDDFFAPAATSVGLPASLATPKMAFFEGRKGQNGKN